ncbi:hypothetical protein [Herbiconiux solani]|uniref:hypothetical protein n=1 Tax=Herbiconiux solani TaxID=661329 RepID=UPI0008268356|nr:hypothetical protein [Herbiconiux solani]
MSALEGETVLAGLDFHPVCTLVNGTCKRPANFAIQMMCCSVVVSMVCQVHKDTLAEHLGVKQAGGQTSVCKQCSTPRLSSKFIRFIPIGGRS